MTRAIQHSRFGGPEVLHLADVAQPVPGPGEVRVTVRAAGLNPIDAKTFDPPLPLRVAELVTTLRHPSRWTGRGVARFPRTVGRDFAGVVSAVGPGVTRWAVGDEVLGTLRSAPGQGETRGSLTEELVAPAAQLVRKPSTMPFAVAATLGVAAQTACGALRTVGVGPGDVLVVSAAAGGVGSLVTQLAVHRGVSVVGIAGPDSQDRLRTLGAVPVVYGPGVTGRVREVAPGPVTAFLDCFGGYVDVARALGAPRGRIGTLVPSPAALAKGARFTGSRAALPQDLPEVVGLIEVGAVEPARVETCSFEVEAVREAYQRLRGGQVHGKLAVIIG